MDIVLARDVEAVCIPGGEHISLPAGATVMVTQSLGGSYTVALTSRAGLYRIAGQDADALGQEVSPAISPAEGPFDEQQIWQQLKNCYDPEIPVNIVDLGLIYSLKIDDRDAGGKHVGIQMTLTAPGCGMGPSLAADAEQRILQVPGVVSAEVQLVWDPPWSPDRISPEGREKLGMV